MADEPYDLLADLDSIDAESKVYDDPTTAREAFTKAPFGYPGGKFRSLGQILPNLPYRAGYIEPFGGSGVVLLNRGTSKLEVLNDRFNGIIDFYKTLRDPILLVKLMERLELCLHSREEFQFSKTNWATASDVVERAALWYYSAVFSFSGLQRNFGRSTKSNNSLPRKFHERLADFPIIHDRIKHVTIENQDWRLMLKDFDHPSHVFYMDPPYVNAHYKTYKHEPNHAEHQELVARIHEMKAFVALSGYENEIYDSVIWDAKKTWTVNVSINPMGANHESNHKDENAHGERGTAIECLWIKEAQ